MKLSTFLLLVFASFNIFSQEPIRINLDSLLVGTQADNANVYVEDVIDNRLYSAYLGIAQLGSYNLKVPIKFEDPLKVELSNFFKRIFPFSPSKTPITIRINEFFIKENTQILTEVGDVSLKFDILKRKEEEVYFWLDSYDVVYQKRMLDATNGNIVRLAEVLMEAINIVSSNGDVNKSDNVIDLSYKVDPPILTSKPNLGFYYTYSELANNLIADNIETTTKEKSKNKGSNTITINDSKGNPVNQFAYFDGENFYLNAACYSDSNYFIKTFRLDNFLLFTEDFIADYYITGLTIAKGKSGYKYVKSRRPVLFNLADGKFYTVRRDNMAQLLETKYPDLYKRFKKNEKKDVQKTFEIIKFLFEHEDAEKVREILTS